MSNLQKQCCMSQSLVKCQDWLLLLSLGNFKIVLVGFYMLSIVTILKQNGYTLNQLSIFYLLGFTELTQLAISLIIQRYQVNNKLGHFRFWLLLSSIIIFMALFGLFWIDVKTQFGWLMVLCLVLSLMGNFLAGATLGLTATILNYHERSFGGVISVISARLGRMIGGGLVLFVYQYWGWSFAIGLMLLLSVILLIQVYFYNEPIVNMRGNSENLDTVSWLAIGKRIVNYWYEPGKGWKWFALLLFSCMPYTLTATTFVPILSDQGWNPAEIGSILGIYLPIICIVIGPISAIVLRRYSRFTVILYTLIALLIVYGSFIFSNVLQNIFEYSLIIQIMILNVLYTFLLPAFMALFMDKASKGMATLDSSLQYTIMIGGGAIASFFSLRIANHFGFTWVYILATIISLSIIIFLSSFCRTLLMRNE